MSKNGLGGAPIGNRNREKHGLGTMKRALLELGSRAIDRRTSIGRELTAWRSALVSDLGGEDELSTQRLALVDLCVRTRLLLDSIDAYLLDLGSLVNKRRRALHPVVRERQLLADALSRYLGQLGLHRRSKPLPALSDYIRARDEAASTSSARGNGHHSSAQPRDETGAFVAVSSASTAPAPGDASESEREDSSTVAAGLGTADERGGETGDMVSAELPEDKER
jgi:hypothetical protein